MQWLYIDHNLGAITPFRKTTGFDNDPISLVSKAFEFNF